MSSVITVSFEMLIFLNLSMERHSVERRVVIVSAKKSFPASICFEKESNFSNFFETGSTFPIAPSVS